MLEGTRQNASVVLGKEDPPYMERVAQNRGWRLFTKNVLPDTAWSML